MDFLRYHLLTGLIFLPAVGALTILLIPRRSAARWTALGITLAVFLASLLLPVLYDWHWGDHFAYADSGGVVQMVQRCNWINAIHAQYLVGIDGLSLPLVILTAFIFVLACVASWNEQRSAKGFLFLLLLLETTVLGTYLALDFFLFYAFLQASLLPVFLMLAIWGGTGRGLAARKFLLTGLLGSISLLIILIQMFHRSHGILFPGGTFDLVQLAQPALRVNFAPASKFLFLLTVFAFLTRLPSVPLHSWLGGTFVEAPMALGIAIAGSMLSVGGYGLFRIAYLLFPQAAQSFWLLMAIIGLLNIYYGAACALGQNDFPRVVAFSAVSQMGFVLLGIALGTWESINGAMIMLISQAVAGAAMFSSAAILKNRTGRDDLSDSPQRNALAAAMPIFTGISLVAFFAAMGLPGLSSFVGQILVLFGAFQAGGTRQFPHIASRIVALLVCFSMVPTAAYLLRTCQRVFFAGSGRSDSESGALRDLDQRELAVMIPLTILMILLGLLPWIFFFAVTNQTAVALWEAFGNSY